ncbi:hypothetical protein EG829_24975 [bacterium]|nr:hypothetical protein [bacterium]
MGEFRWCQDNTWNKPLPGGLFGFNNDAALLALIAGLFLTCGPDFLKVVPPVPLHLETFRAMPSLQFICGNGQMAVATPQPAFLLWQEDQVEMSA